MATSNVRGNALSIEQAETAECVARVIFELAIVRDVITGQSRRSETPQECLYFERLAGKVIRQIADLQTIAGVEERLATAFAPPPEIAAAVQLSQCKNDRAFQEFLGKVSTAKRQSKRGRHGRSSGA